jgi:hypothetical protein
MQQLAKKDQMMAATAILPSLPLVHNWSPEPLSDMSINLMNGAQAWRGTIGTVHAETLSLDWAGKANEAARNTIAQVHQTVTQNADSLESASRIASNGASTLLTMANEVNHMVDKLTSDQYIIEPTTYEVENDKRGTSLQEYIERSQKAEVYTTQLQFKVTNFAEARDKIATDLIQAVDNCLTPDQIKKKLWHDAVKGAIPGGIAGGVALGPIGILTGGSAGAIGNDTGDLLDILNGATRVCNKP